ncbi:MAG: two-component system, OmpR family, phosphate regulon sensor histidine kinase PhoR [Gemmatimonadaceae bacterium]|nr:two-component system, OmpR family, phosphate regulon sensor histidine kinase PhoR [Gemmatimonadaceae bacterium]
MKLAQRLLLQSLAIVAVMVVSVVVIIDNQLYSRITDQAIHDLAGEARLLAAQWKPGVDADSLADEAGSATGHRITLIDSVGHVAGDSEFDGPALQRLENHSSRPEVIAARSGEVGSVRRMSPSTGEEQVYVAVKAPRGVARVSVTTRTVEEIFGRARNGVIAAGLISFLLAAILAVLFSRSVSRPIVELRDVARSIAAGERRRHPALSAPGEVGDLADAIYRLAEQLEARLAALAAEQSILTALVETLNEGVLAISPAREVVRINETGRRLLSIDRPLPFGIDYLPRESTLRSAISLALNGTETQPEEVVIEGNTMSLTARPLVSGGAVVALFDLTAIRKLETVRRDFVANVSHELRTPLTIVGGFAETLQDPDIPPERKAEFAQTIYTNTQRMQRIVDELLDLSRIESGHWKPRPQNVRIAEVAAEVFARVAAAAAKKGVRLETASHSGVTTIHADRTALEQILLNLVENALRHTAQGGSITVGTSLADSGVVLEVRDTGSGISPEHLPRIFERFYRADSGRSREAGGTGLGLAIVKHLVEAHGGSVGATSVVGSGTTIRIFFPEVSSAVQS